MPLLVVDATGVVRSDARNRSMSTPDRPGSPGSWVPSPSRSSHTKSPTDAVVNIPASSESMLSPDATVTAACPVAGLGSESVAAVPAPVGEWLYAAGVVNATT